MDARKIPKGYYIPKIFEEIIIEEDGYNHHVTEGKYLTPGSYAMIKPESYFNEVSPFYGFGDEMWHACECIFKIKDIDYDYYSPDYPRVVKRIFFEKPEGMTADEEEWFSRCIEDWSWNNEMVIPLIKNSRNIKI